MHPNTQYRLLSILWLSTAVLAAPLVTRADDVRPKKPNIVFVLADDLVTEIKGVGNGANFYPYRFRTQPISWLNVEKQRLPSDEYLIDRMNLEAVEFIERHRDEPFFLYLSHFATHTILRGKEELVEKYRKKHPPGPSTRTKCYLCEDAGIEGEAGNHWAGHHNPHLASMLESIDDGIGMIADKLDQLGLAENTIVVFTSDNGGESPNVTSNAPLRGGKSQLYEGGIREPLIVRWPKRIPPGRVCGQPTMNVDFYPTFLDAAGIKRSTKQQLDGVSILRLLTDPESRLEQRTFYWHYPLEKPHFLGGRSAGATRLGWWKLIEFFDTGEVELYDLSEDVGEQNNLAEKHPDVVAGLRDDLARWRSEVGAEVPPPRRM